MVTSDDLIRMTVDILLGRTWVTRSRSIPDGPEHRKSWDRIAAQIAEIIANGQTVDIPNEWPDLG